VKRFALELLLIVSRLATAVLFAWAAMEKLKSPRDFYFSIKGFQLLPEHMLQPLAFMVPWVELVCAAALLVGFWARSAAIVIGGMLLVFIGAVVSVLVRPDLHVECGCFGDFTLLCAPGEVGWCNVGQNLLLFLVAFPVMAWGPGWLALDRPEPRGGCCGVSACACGAKAPAVDSEPAAS